MYAADVPPSFSLVSPVFLLPYSPLNSSVNIKVEQWEYEIYASEPQVVSFEEQECLKPPDQIFSWVEKGVTVIVWKSRASLLCRYIIYRSEKDGNLAALNFIPLSTTRFIDTVHNDMETFSYHVEPVGIDGKKGWLSEPALWLEPEMVPEILD